MLAFVTLLPLALVVSEAVLAAPPSRLQARQSKAPEASKAPKAPKASNAPKAPKASASKKGDGPAASAAPPSASSAPVPSSDPGEATPPAAGGGGGGSGGSGGGGGGGGGLIGYASMNGGTTGGGSAAPTVVTTLAALRTACAGTTPRVVTVNGIIKGDGAIVSVGSNISIQGGAGGGLTGSGFRIAGQKNIIIRNMRISLSKAPVDLIGVTESTNIWIHKNELFNDLTSGKDFYDGAADFTRNSDFITVSWNHFHDTEKTSLIGHSDTFTADKGTLRITYHHNRFEKVGSRLPSLRFGTGHVFNNYFKDVSISGIMARLGAQMLIENNVFENVKKPISTAERGGFAVQKGNTFVGSDAPDTAQVGTLTTMPYKYTLDAVTGVKAAVIAGAKPA